MQGSLLQRNWIEDINEAFVGVFQASPPEDFIENFNVVLTQYTASLQCIVPVFMYLVGIVFLFLKDGIALQLLSHNVLYCTALLLLSLSPHSMCF